MRSSNKLALLLLIAVGVYLHKAGHSLFNFRPKPSSLISVPLDPSLAPYQNNYPSDAETPIIKKIDGRQTLIIPKADYRITGRVVSKRHYFMDWFSKLSPVDLAIAWGPLATKKYDPFVTFSHTDRFYNYHYSADMPDDPSVIATHSANEHLIPANAHIAKALKSVDVDEILEIEGYLVNVEASNGDSGAVLMNTSLLRTDTGAGACEIIYVTKVTIGNEVFK